MTTQKIVTPNFLIPSYWKFSSLVTFLSNHYFFSIVLFFFLGKLLYAICLVWHLGAFSSNLFQCRWDCGWYQSLIDNGYQLAPFSVDKVYISGQANWAFFPLLPMVGKMLLALFGDSLSIVLFNQAALLGSLLLLYHYCLANYSKEIALTSVFLLSISSENVYFFSLYTESLFLFLSLLTVYFLSKKKYLTAGIVCSLLSATRPQGFLMALPLLFAWLRDHEFKLTKQTGCYFIFLSLLSISGLLIFMVYLQIHVGDFLAFYHIQSTWGRNYTSWLHPFDILKNMIKDYPLEFILAIISVYGSYYFYKKKKYTEFMFLLLPILIMFSSQILLSYTRYIFGLYCTYILLGAWAQASYKRMFCFVILTIIFHVFIAHSWFTGINDKFVM